MTGLAGLLDEHGEAVEYDLLGKGFRLRWLDDPRKDFNWRDLLVIVSRSRQGSEVFRSLHGDDEAEWSLTNHLLAMNVENTAMSLWMETQDAQRKPPRNRPKPIYRPGVEDDSKQTIGGDKLEIADMLDFLGDDYVTLAA